MWLEATAFWVEQNASYATLSPSLLSPRFWARCIQWCVKVLNLSSWPDQSWTDHTIFWIKKEKTPSGILRPPPHPTPPHALYTLNLIYVLADALWLQKIQFSSLPLHVCKGLLNSLSPRNKPDIPKKRGATFLLKACFGSCLPRFRRVQEPQKREGDQTEWCSNPWVESVDAALSQCQMKGSFVTVTPAN